MEWTSEERMALLLTEPTTRPSTIINLTTKQAIRILGKTVEKKIFLGNQKSNVCLSYHTGKLTDFPLFTVFFKFNNCCVVSRIPAF